MTNIDSFRQCALLIAHPGHELRVHGWLEKTRPIVYVLTDGSGRSGNSRLESTTQVLARAGARPGTIYGRLRDRELYSAVLQSDAALFRGLATELATEIVRHGIDFVLGDAEEGEILAHDLWRSMIDAAIAVAKQRIGSPIASYEFGLHGSPVSQPDALPSESICLRLADDALARKISAARSYPELKDEVETAFSTWGEDAFREEYFKPALGQAEEHPRECPHYELHGEKLVAAGIYAQTVRYDRHVAPLLAEINR